MLAVISTMRPFAPEVGSLGLRNTQLPDAHSALLLRYRTKSPGAVGVSEGRTSTPPAFAAALAAFTSVRADTSTVARCSSTTAGSGCKRSGCSTRR